jgi:hypothetical protein
MAWSKDFFIKLQHYILHLTEEKLYEIVKKLDVIIIFLKFLFATLICDFLVHVNDDVHACQCPTMFMFMSMFMFMFTYMFMIMYNCTDIYVYGYVQFKLMYLFLVMNMNTDTDMNMDTNADAEMDMDMNMDTGTGKDMDTGHELEQPDSCFSSQTQPVKRLVVFAISLRVFFYVE